MTANHTSHALAISAAVALALGVWIGGGAAVSAAGYAASTGAGASADTLQAFRDYQDAKAASETADAVAQTALGSVIKSADNSGQELHRWPAE